MNQKILSRIISAAKINMKAGPELVPTFFICKDDHVEIVAAHWNDVESKDATAFIVKSHAAKMDADYIIFVAESWIIDGDKSEEFMKNRDKYPEVKDFPHKKEVVVFQVETRDYVQMGRAEILQDRELSEIQWSPKSGDFEGRFVGLLGQKGPVQ